MASPVQAPVVTEPFDLGERLRGTRARVRPVSQVLVRLQQPTGQDLFEATVDKVLVWINKRAGKRLPDEAWRRQSFELNTLGAQRTAAVALQEPRYWAARLDDADRTVPQRTWITEIGVGLAADGAVLFGSRLTCATRGEDPPFERSVPTFVRNVVSSMPARLDGRLVRQDAEVVSDAAGVESLVDLLEDVDRRHAVIVVALPDDGTDPSEAAIDVSRVHLKTLAAAHVCVLTGPASMVLSRVLGKEFSVFRQAVRLYRPGFRRWRSNPYDHPLALPERIARWNDDGPRAFEGWVTSQALATTAHSADREERLPSFETVRRWASQLQRKAARDEGRSDEELLGLADAEIKRLEGVLQEQKQTYDGLLDAIEVERDEAVGAKQEALALAATLRARVERLQEALASAGTETPIPDDLESFGEWCDSHLSGDVIVMSRARRGAKQSVYEQPSLIYEALLLLRDYFVPMKRSPCAESSERFQAELLRLNLEDSAVGRATQTHAEHYTVRYGGRPHVLDWHLKRGTSREPVHCFRLYYFWDDESQCAVVGWLPSHLSNALS